MSEFPTAQAAAATPHPQAAQAARLALSAGGNAIDAAAAAMLTLCVVMPQQVGLGGYGGSLVLHTAAGRNIAIDFDTVAPGEFRPELYPNPQLATHGYLAVSVPGIVAGLALAVKDHGKLGFPAACEHAADVADQGFAVDATYARQIAQWESRTDAVSRRALFPGDIPRDGDTWTQPDVARLLRRLAAAGPESFYHGDIPATICRQVRAHGGILGEADFASYRPRYVDPVETPYRGHRILTPPPPSGGITTLQILKVLEQFDVSKIEPFSADHFHLFAEVTKLCWADRRATAGDPDFVEMPIDRLLSDEEAARKAARIRRDSVAAFPIERPGGGSHTANVCICDREGNLVSVTATQGYLFGSQVVIDGLGLVMGHGMSRFDFDDASPNRPVVGKRPFHNMAPTIVLKDNRPRLAVGLPGGPKIITVTAQLLVDLIDFGLSPAETVAAPRIHVETQDPLAVSSGVSDATVRGLEHRGHTIRRGQDIGGPPNEIAGSANALLIGADGRPTAASQGGPSAALAF